MFLSIIKNQAGKNRDSVHFSQGGIILKRCVTYIIIFIILCSISNYSIDYVQGKQINEQSPYYLSFASIGAIYLESRLDCWAKIRTSSTTQELQDYLVNILKTLDIPALGKHDALNDAIMTAMMFLKLKGLAPAKSTFYTS